MRPLTSKEIEFICRYAGLLSAAKMAKLLGRSESAVRKVLKELEGLEEEREEGHPCD